MKMTDLVEGIVLNELSKETLSNYLDKADMDIVKKHRVRGPQAAAGDKEAVAKTDKKIDKRMKGIDSANKRLNKEVDEGHYRRPGSPSAYDRDYRSSTSGMGKHDSLAYQLDGGANDEGWDREPQQRYQAPEDKPRLLGYYFYDVPAGMESEAAIYGVKKTKSGKWAKAKYSTSGRSYGMQKDGADKAFGPGKWWAPANESATAGATSAGNVGVGAVYKNKPPKKQKPTDNALDGDNLMTGGSIKR